MRGPSFRYAGAAAAIALLVALLPGTGGAALPAAEISSLAQLAGTLETQHATETGTLGHVRATDGVLWRDEGGSDPPARAQAFLARFGDVIGLSEAERLGTNGSELVVAKVERDVAGNEHVRLDQRYEGLDVFGAQVVVHLNDEGVYGVNGAFVPGISLDPQPSLSAAQARASALRFMDADTGGARLRASVGEPAVYRTGLVEGYHGRTALAYPVDVDGGPDGPLQVWVDADTGHILNRGIPQHQGAKDRVVYSPEFLPEYPDLFVVRTEDGPPNPVPPIDNLYEFTGQTYDLFRNTFGRDSYDGEGIPMRTVYLINDICPNAYWDGYTTNYCPGLDLDDVVGHEWGHAYTRYTHNLIYQCQPGALNESYSDIWGEVIDLLNGVDGIGGDNNDEPWPDGQRWLVGEDLTQRVHQLLLRDMWNPTRLGDPDRVTSPAYYCGEEDNEGVHWNSGVPNHAFAMLTDGKTFRGVEVEGIGLTKASHIYWQAQLAYQTPTSKFRDHEQALHASCADLTGVELPALMTGEPSGEVIGAHDCDQLAKAMIAVEMSVPVRCRYSPLLTSGAPERCEDADIVFADDFSAGLDDWTLETEAGSITASWADHLWTPTSDLPGGRTGTAAFAVSEAAGNCRRGPDISGRFSMDTPEITVPSDGLQLSFDHYVATWRGTDGGNVKISVNDGEFVELPMDAYVFNGPNEPLRDAVVDRNTNPLAGQDAWTGTDRGEVTGSWGTTVADLSEVAEAGDVIRLRFDFGVNCAGGIDGWYVDDVVVYACPSSVPEVTSGSVR